jgi:hypothetical protein
MAEAARTPGRGRRAVPIVLVVLATIVGLVSVFALWAERQLLEEDTWKQTSTELIEDPTISDAVADYAVTELFANVDVQARLEKRIEPVAPRLASPLSGAISGALRQLADDAAREALQQPKIQALWVDLTSTAQQRVIALLEDKGEFVSTTGGTVTLDLKQVVAVVAEQTGLPDVSDKLPPDTAELEIMRSDQLGTAQSALQLLKTLAWFLTALTLVLYAAAIYLAKGRRRETLRAVGIAFVLIGAVVLIARNAAGTAVTESLATTSTAEPAVSDAWEIGTSLLKETGQSIIFYGIVIVLAAWLAGPTGVATWIRREITPYFRRPATAYSTLVVLLILLFLWDPVIATHRLVPSLILIGLLALGFEMLRRQVIREFPDRVTTHSPEGIAQRMATRMRGAVPQRAATAQPAAPGGVTPAALERLTQLGELHERNVLSDEEFEREKAKLLGSGPQGVN